MYFEKKIKLKFIRLVSFWWPRLYSILPNWLIEKSVYKDQSKYPVFIIFGSLAGKIEFCVLFVLYAEWFGNWKKIIDIFLIDELKYWISVMYANPFWFNLNVFLKIYMSHRLIILRFNKRNIKLWLTMSENKVFFINFDIILILIDKLYF